MVADLVQLHLVSAHIIYSVDIVGGSLYSATDMWGSPAGACACGRLHAHVCALVCMRGRACMHV